MSINDVLDGSAKNLSVDEQKTTLDEMKNKLFFELSNDERKNLTNFLCESSEKDVAIDYLFHVLDNEISYPIDDDKVKILFSDDRMLKMKDLMMEELQDEDSEQ